MYFYRSIYLISLSLLISCSVSDSSLKSGIKKDNFDKVKEILSKNSIHYDELGIVTEKDIIIDSKSKVTINELNSSSKTWLTEYMSK